MLKLFRAAAGAAVVALLAVLLFRCTDVRAAEPMSKSEWYRSLQQPITHRGCCSEADCAQAPAKLRADGVWLVPPVDHIENNRWVPAPGEWLPVPEALILRDKDPVDGVSAVLCMVGGQIFCFVPGAAGG